MLSAVLLSLCCASCELGWSTGVSPTTRWGGAKLADSGGGVVVVNMAGLKRSKSGIAGHCQTADKNAGGPSPARPQSAGK